MADKSTEIRFELPSGDLAVLDGYCNGTGKDRTKVLKEIIASWSAEKLHVSMIVCRVAGVNPQSPEFKRHE
jgi:hypothetical protein